MIIATENIFYLDLMAAPPKKQLIICNQQYKINSANVRRRKLKSIKQTSAKFESECLYCICVSVAHMCVQMCILLINQCLYGVFIYFSTSMDFIMRFFPFFCPLCERFVFLW